MSRSTAYTLSRTLQGPGRTAACRALACAARHGRRRNIRRAEAAEPTAPALALNLNAATESAGRSAVAPVSAALATQAITVSPALNTIVRTRLIIVALRHLLGESPIGLSQLAQQMNLPEPLVRHQLVPFVTAELLVSGWRGKEPTYSLARDVDTIHLGQLLHILECGWNQAPLLTDAERNLRSLLESRVVTRDADTERLSLRDLVQQCDAPSPN